MKDLTRDQLNGTPEIGTKVKMMGIEATVESTDYVSSHNCWVLNFITTDGKKQQVPATKVAQAIKDGKMEVLK